MKYVEEESDYENQSIETSHIGNELEVEEHEMTPGKCTREQRRINRYGNAVLLKLNHKRYKKKR